MHELMQSAKEIEMRISSASASDRLAMQPELTKLMRNMHENRVPIPTRLRNLEAELTSEAIEARFDNVPL